jgi:hypothetical protein
VPNLLFFLPFVFLFGSRVVLLQPSLSLQQTTSTLCFLSFRAVNKVLEPAFQVGCLCFCSSFCIGPRVVLLQTSFEPAAGYTNSVWFELQGSEQGAGASLSSRLPLPSSLFSHWCKGGFVAAKLCGCS